MHRKSVSRLALTTLLAAAACAQLRAQTPHTPTITFAQPVGITVHQALIPSFLDVLPVSITVTAPAGLIDAMLSGGYSSAVGIYPGHPASGTLTLYFYYDYGTPGNYTFQATAYDVLSQKTVKSLVVTVLKP